MSDTPTPDPDSKDIESAAPTPPSAPPTPDAVPTPDPASAADVAAPADLPSALDATSTGAPTTELPVAAAPAIEIPPAPAIPELSPAECSARLAALFPALFTPGSPHPLKLRIQADIQQRAPGQFTRKTLSIFLHRHTTTTAYLKSLVAAAQRVDLDGADAGELSDEHREAAVAELDRRRAVHDARRAAEREAHRKSRGEGGGRRDHAPTAPATPQADGASAPQGQAPGAEQATAAAPAGPSAPRAPRPDRHHPPGGRQGAERGGAARGEQAGRRDGAAARNTPPRTRDEAPGQPPPRRDSGRDRQRPDARGPQGRPGGAGAATPRHGGGGHAHAHAHAPRPPQSPEVDTRLPDDEGARNRLLLLRAFESTTLTRANFCALKGMKDADLEVQLVQARQEQAQRSQAQRAQAKAQRQADAAAPRPDKPG